MGSRFWDQSLLIDIVPPMGWPWPGAVLAWFVVASAAFLYLWPQYRLAWGLIIAFCSIVTFFVAIGGVIPGALGIIGGVLTLTSRPEGRLTKQSSYKEFLSRLREDAYPQDDHGRGIQKSILAEEDLKEGNES